MIRLQSSLPWPAGCRVVVIAPVWFSSGEVVSYIGFVTVHLEGKDLALAPAAFSIRPKVAVNTPVCPNATGSVNPVTVPVTLTVMMLLVAGVAVNHSPLAPLAGLLLLFTRVSVCPLLVLLKGTVKKLGRTCVLVAQAVLAELFCVVR